MLSKLYQAVIIYLTFIYSIYNSWSHVTFSFFLFHLKKKLIIKTGGQIIYKYPHHHLINLVLKSTSI